MADLPLPDARHAADDSEAARRLAARVVAWQHRQPLARRITPAAVGGIGVIALPYGPAGPAGEPAPLFHQPALLPGLTHQALADFARAHAVPERPGPPSWPQRVIERADARDEPAPQLRYLLTAAIAPADPRRALPQRVLIAPAGHAIWGRRPPSRARAVAAAGLGALLAAMLVRVGLHGRAPAPLPAGPTPSVRDAGSAPRPASAPASERAATPASSPGPVAAPRAAAAVPSSPLPSATPASVAAAVAPPPAPLPPASAATPGGPHFALVSAPTRQRAAAEATLARIRQVLGPAMGLLQSQVMASPEGFVVTVWPLPTQADAEGLAEVLARRGVPMKWLEF